VGAVAAAPDGLAPLDAAAAGLEAAGAVLPERREHARERQAVIDANADLQERELIKLASMSAALAGALRDRGVAPERATLTAEIAISVFKVAFERWIGEGEGRDFTTLVRASLAELRELSAS
jgi:hypothetical protein